ncbi:fatty acyl-AMP ligase [Kitasatospora kifunensis]|uniref:Acyl-CoA synthetase (AMP-forming)/AMP-acid ligase II n=1 Tax=Kitasatospora kifunensis TaxID=58351 RepID=A0A7W7RA95_KITKI|nr:fatty acyl-AMP ligase [Kitasatospora kifunensis]MBB4928219.1 acyl-CoA synthetase (AMP-forming)/AMP-acid ligase II [Kitasatospora kifunensis]
MTLYIDSPSSLWVTPRLGEATAPATDATEPRTLADALVRRSEEQPDKVAYVFLHEGEEPGETLTYRELHEAARIRAAALAARGLTGRTAVLLYPSGLEFVRSLLGCLYARVIGAPVQVPRQRHGLARLRRIADDAGTSTVLTTASVKADLEERFGDSVELAGLTLIATESLGPAPTGARGTEDRSTLRPPEPGDIALLQYTSGSTGDPKGVIVTHANFLANAVETEALWPSAPNGTVVNWLPLFHDMGMLFGVVLPLWAGVPSYLMAPHAFIRRPARWLEAISRFRATHAAAPSFAYELCVRAQEEGKTAHVGDLSSWRVAVNGAEPVRLRTVRAFTDAFARHGFDPAAMCPGYGLAENTLKATGSRQDTAPTALWLSAQALREGRAEVCEEPSGDTTPVVSSGVTVGGTRVRIVDPQTLRECPSGRVGEIWISGPCVAEGYWRRPEAGAETFRARVLDDDAVPGTAAETYLRSGDLGFLHDDELYVTGRLKDVIIRNGRNYYPQDIELSAETSIPGLHPNCAAAFSVDDGGTERIVVVVEADGRVLRAHSEQDLRTRVRDAVWDNHRLEADEVLVVRRGALSKTSSGKVQRRACRKRYEEGAFRPQAPRSAASDGSPRRQR